MLARRALDSLAALAGTTNLVLASPPPIASILAPEFPGARWLMTGGHGAEEARHLGLAFHQAHIERLILFPDSFSSRVTAFYSGAHERIGHGPRGWDLEAALGLTKSVPRRKRGERHLEEEYLDLARAAGGEVRTPRRLTLAPEAQASADGLLAGVSEPLILAPGARYGPAKRWPAARFAEVARAWRRGGVVVVGDQGDREETSAVSSLLEGRVLDLTGKTDLPTLAGVLARAAVVVSNDSGAAHVAAALGRPTVIVFGSTDPGWTAPRGEHVTVIQDLVRCSPCFRSECPLEDAYACLRIVESDRVIRALPQ
jgi:heptosyltransferase-2